MTDNYLLLGAKKRLIEELREKGISDEQVLQAFDKVERHRFVESFLWPKAYQNVALKLLNGQTISHPYTVAFQSQLLQIQKGDKVLEIGTGSGFQAAILSAMGAKVYTIERQELLFRKTSALLEPDVKGCGPFAVILFGHIYLKRAARPGIDFRALQRAINKHMAGKGLEGGPKAQDKDKMS